MQLEPVLPLVLGVVAGHPVLVGPVVQLLALPVPIVELALELGDVESALYRASEIRVEDVTVPQLSLLSR